LAVTTISDEPVVTQANSAEIAKGQDPEEASAIRAYIHRLVAQLPDPGPAQMQRLRDLLPPALRATQGES
jgi:hypothetical protein